jgi:hypothetical protein
MVTLRSQTDNRLVLLWQHLVPSCVVATIMELANPSAEEFCMSQMSGNYSSQVLAAIRRRAAELYRGGGGVEGHDAENWYRAEAEIIRESSTRPARRSVVVNVQGVVYTGEYESNSADGYAAGEWKPGDSVPIRFAGDKLFLLRPNGRELQTTIVKRIG